jgi:hypothetical protein
MFGESDLGDKLLDPIRTAASYFYDVLHSPMKFVIDLFEKDFGAAVLNIWDSLKGLFSSLATLIRNGLKLNPFNLIFKGAMYAFEKLGEWWFGKSPSKVGLGILKGIQSAAGMIGDALLFPFIFVYDKIKNVGFWIGENIIQGIKPLPELIFSTLKSPFVAIWDWLKGTFFGNSPSQLALNILKGVSSVGSMVLDVLMWPFKKSFELISNFGSTISGVIMNGFRDLPSLIFDALKSPFTSVWDWLSNTFFGNSPSQLALNIVKGIQAVTGMISDILLAPFRFVKDTIGKLFGWLFGQAQQDPTTALSNSLAELSEGKLSLIKEVASLLSSDALSSNILKTAESIEGLSESINKISAMDVMKLTVLQAGQVTKEVVSNRKLEEPKQIVAKSDNESLVKVMSEVRDLLKNGAVTVHLDGRKVSRQLASKVY